MSTETHFPLLISQSEKNWPLSFDSRINPDSGWWARTDMMISPSIQCSQAQTDHILTCLRPQLITNLITLQNTLDMVLKSNLIFSANPLFVLSESFSQNLGWRLPLPAPLPLMTLSWSHSLPPSLPPSLWDDWAVSGGSVGVLRRISRHWLINCWSKTQVGVREVWLRRDVKWT